MQESKQRTDTGDQIEFSFLRGVKERSEPSFALFEGDLGTSGRRRIAFEMSPKAETSFFIELFFFTRLGVHVATGAVDGVSSLGAFQDMGGTRRSVSSAELDPMLQDVEIHGRRCGA